MLSALEVDILQYRFLEEHNVCANKYLFIDPQCREMNHAKRAIQKLHDLVNGQGFAMHCRAISNTVSHLEVSNVRESIQQS